MMLMIVGLALFFLIHLVPAAPEVRRSLAERMGEGPYKIFFCVFAAVGLALIVYGYAKLHGTPGKNPVIWSPPPGMRHATLLLMLVASILLAAAYIPSRIRSAARHPMLAAIKLWALAHLLVRGDLASMVLFGSFLGFAIFDRISVKERAALGPLGAKTGGLGGDIAVLVVGVGLYALMLLWGHARLIGIPLVPGWA